MYPETEGRDFMVSLIMSAVIFMMLPDILDKMETVVCILGLSAGIFAGMQTLSMEMETIKKKREQMRIRPKGTMLQAHRNKVVDIRLRREIHIPAFREEAGSERKNA